MSCVLELDVLAALNQKNPNPVNSQDSLVCHDNISAWPFLVLEVCGVNQINAFLSKDFH